MVDCLLQHSIRMQEHLYTSCMVNKIRTILLSRFIDDVSSINLNVRSCFLDKISGVWKNEFESLGI